MLINNHHMHPAVYARKMSTTFNAVIQDEELRFRVERFSTDLARSLMNAGCELIGHIKGLIAAGVAGYLMFSVTSHDEPVRFKGELKTGIKEASMTVNIIVYGVGPDAVETAFEKAYQRLCFTEN
jgi:hypothetical protein